MDNSSVNEHCKNIQKHLMDITVEQLETSFDVFVAALKESNSPEANNKLMENIIFSLGSLPHRRKILITPNLFEHELLPLIRDSAIVDKLHEIRTKQIDTQRILVDSVNFFMNIGHDVNNSNIVGFKKLIFYTPLIDEVSHCFEEISKTGKHLNDYVLLRSLRSLLTVYKHIMKKGMTTDDYLLIAPIFFSITQCLCSSYTIEMIKSLEQTFYQKLDESKRLILHIMPWYLQWYGDYRDPENFIQILRTLLHEFTTWITSCQPDSFVQCSHQIGVMVRSLTFFLVRPIESDNVNIFSAEFYDDYCKLVLHWTLFLPSTLSYCSNKTSSKSVAQTIVQMLYNFTLHLNVLTYMKTIPNLIPMLLQMTELQHDEIQLNAYRCLGKIMVEDDIKMMTNPGKIAVVYIDFIRNTIEDSKKTERFSSLLFSLKSFVQHDQLKTELIKQGILPLLMKCVVETQAYPNQVQKVAIEILLSLSFINEACLILKQNEKFMCHNRSLAESTSLDDNGLKRAAEVLLWKLEKEVVAVAKPTILTSYKYDIMISYSHRDKNLCFRIYEELVKDGFKVWIDKDCLYGATMAGIANAIENSERVLICMSNTYKESVFCQSEAHYAFERRCRLIPIMFQADYKPDGWLGIIVSGKLYVDFVKSEFKLAYERLKIEVTQQQQQQQQSSICSNQSLTNSVESLDYIDTSLMSSNNTEIISETIEELPHCITQWTHDHVRLFLLRIELGNTILPLCTRIDGDRLLHLYEMCLSNRESMYQSLKYELQERHHTLLPISDYLTFLHHVKLYIPSVSTTVVRSSLHQSTECNII